MIKNTYILLTSVAFPFLAFATVPDLEIAHKIGYAYYGSATIDGEVSEGEWAAAMAHDSHPIATFINNGAMFPPTDDADLSGEFWVMWDEEAFYFLIMAKDESFPSIPEANPARSDAITIYTSAAYTRIPGDFGTPGYDGSSDIQAAFNFGVDTFSATHGLYSYESNTAFPETVLRSYMQTEDGYIAEIKIPMDVILGDNVTTGVSFQDGVFYDGPDSASVGSEREFIGFDINMQDSDNGLERETKLAWCGGYEGNIADMQWASTEMWGTLVLVQPEIEPPPCTVLETVMTETYFPSVGTDFVFNTSMESYLFTGFCPFAYDFNTADWWYVYEESTDPEGFFVYSFNGSMWYYVLAGYVLEL